MEKLRKLKITKEDFEAWNEEKTNLHFAKVKEKKVKKRQIWLFKAGVNIGNETGKQSPFMRPCLVLNENLKGDLILIAPITSKGNENISDTSFEIKKEDTGLKFDSFVLLHHIKSISKKRLVRKKMKVVTREVL